MDNSKGIMGEYPKEQGSNNGTNSPNGKTDISFVGRQGTANDLTARETENGTANDTSRTRLVNPKRQSLKPKDTENERGRGTGMPKSAESLPKETTSQTNSWGSDIISSTCVETFKARVEYAKSLGIEEGVAVRICNLAQSEKFPLCEMHYKGFVGKSGKEVEEGFNLLKFLAKRGKSSKCQGHNGLRRIDSS